MRIGNGFDVHRFAKGRKLILGGVDVPFDKGLEGHSDADVVIHSAIDSILGALGANDIGTHYPDTDPKYEGISSVLLLVEIVKHMKSLKYHLNNLDIIIHAEEPMLRDYIQEMRSNISRVFDCQVGRVNIKATSWEGLGFVGKKQGIAASAVCLILSDAYDEDSDELPFGTAHLFDDITIPEPEQVDEDLFMAPDVDTRGSFTAWVDGASKGNPGPSGIGVVIQDADGITLAEISEKIGEATNNVAEYKALIRALQEVKFLKGSGVVVKTDSQLMARQIDGKYKVNDPGLKKLFVKAMDIASSLDVFRIVHISRDENKDADKLASDAVPKKKKK